MSKIRVNSITSIGGTAPVVFETGITGDGSGLTMKPVAVSFDPTATATGISTTTNITVVFDQDVEFSGVGTIYIREGSASGTIATSFTCGVSAGATIAGSSLVINPTDPLEFNQLYVVSLPSVGIANTLGAYYGGTDGYSFTTSESSFSATGGTYEFTRVDGSSPTGYYKYHIFTSSGPFVTSGPTLNATDWKSLMVAGGGGGGVVYGLAFGGGGGAGGRLYQTGPQINLGGGSWTITVGAGGVVADNTPGQDGNDTTISNPSGTVLTVYGGGGGGTHSGNASNPSVPGNPGGSGGGGSVTPGNTFYPPSSPNGGSGVAGQGNPGGNHSVAIPSQRVSTGGGGAGGVGGNTSYQVPTGTGSSGNGGPGSPSPEFNSTVLSPIVTAIPTSSYNEIGPSGLYGGGGGGSKVDPANISGGLGGPGGGGRGASKLQNQPANFVPAVRAENGYSFTGGGGGAAGASNGYSASGGSGVFMVRYATPSS